MTRQEYIDEIRLKLTGDILELEMDDENIGRVLDSAVRELQRYITSSKMVTTQFKPCIDLSTLITGYEKDTDGNNKLDKDGNPIPIYLEPVSSVVTVYRQRGMANADTATSSTINDPMEAAQWQLLSGMGNITYFQDAVYNFSAYSTTQQIRNTLSTDMFFRYDRASNKLYINVSTGTPESVTIEYIPVIRDVEEITSYYWQDQLVLLALALTKVTIGRIRSKFTQSNALWQNDGATILAEGQQELQSIREHLLQNTELTYPID